MHPGETTDKTGNTGFVSYVGKSTGFKFLDSHQLKGESNESNAIDFTLSTALGLTISILSQKMPPLPHISHQTDRECITHHHNICVFC